MKMQKPLVHEMTRSNQQHEGSNCMRALSSYEYIHAWVRILVRWLRNILMVPCLDNKYRPLLLVNLTERTMAAR